MIEVLQMLMAPAAVVLILVGVICLVGRPLICRYLGDDQEPEALAKANRDLAKRPRLVRPWSS